MAVALPEALTGRCMRAGAKVGYQLLLQDHAYPGIGTDSATNAYASQ